MRNEEDYAFKNTLLSKGNNQKRQRENQLWKPKNIKTQDGSSTGIGSSEGSAETGCELNIM